jgi:hypothetical protein
MTATPPERQPARTSRSARSPRRTHAADWLDRTDAIDLRRARDAQAADRVILRADWLPSPDRALVLAVLRDGQSVAALARIQRTNPRTLRRRLAAAVARLSDDRTAFVATHAASMPRTRALVARGLYLRGQTLRAIADAHALSLHTVRAHRQAIDGMYEAWRAAGRPAPASRDGAPHTLPDRSWQ